MYSENKNNLAKSKRTLLDIYICKLHHVMDVTTNVKLTSRHSAYQQYQRGLCGKSKLKRCTTDLCVPVSVEQSFQAHVQCVC